MLLQEDGKLYVWGDNAFGQLGLGGDMGDHSPFFSGVTINPELEWGDFMSNTWKR